MHLRIGSWHPLPAWRTVLRGSRRIACLEGARGFMREGHTHTFHVNVLVLRAGSAVHSRHGENIRYPRLRNIRGLSMDTSWLHDGLGRREIRRSPHAEGVALHGIPRANGSITTSSGRQSRAGEEQLPDRLRLCVVSRCRTRRNRISPHPRGHFPHPPREGTSDGERWPLSRESIGRRLDPPAKATPPRSIDSHGHR